MDVENGIKYIHFYYYLIERNNYSINNLYLNLPANLGTYENLQNLLKIVVMIFKSCPFNGSDFF